MPGYTQGYKYRSEGDIAVQVPLELLEGNIEVDAGWARIYRPYANAPFAWLWIRDGYAWDGASGPVVDRPSNMLPSMVHDCLYQLMRRGYIGKQLRHIADRLFRDMCHERGVWKWLSNVYLQALKQYGRNAAENPRTIHEMK